MAASSCVQDEGGLNLPQSREASVHASTVTKTVLDENSVNWVKGDEIALVFTHPEPKFHVETFTTEFEGNTAATAEFKGSIPNDVSLETGYNDDVLAVYPASAVENGKVSFTLPGTQVCGGSFESGMNLSAGLASFAVMEGPEDSHVTFRNTFAIIRVSCPSYATAIRLTGTAPFAGKAPLKFDNESARLVIDTEAEWPEADQTKVLTLLPKDTECFSEEKDYNLLVLPGTHTSLVVELDDKYGNTYKRTISNTLTFQASKFYTLNPNFEQQLILGIDGVEEELDTIDERIENAEIKAEKLQDVLNQIQSVSLMTEYLNNSVYATYAQMMYSKAKKDIKLSYLVRPAAAAKALLDFCSSNNNLSEVLTAKASNRKGEFSDLVIKDAVLEGDILNVTIGASNLWDSFYEGKSDAAVALQISDGNTEILSDFANLVPKHGAVLNITRTDNIPVVKGASFSMSFNYGAADSEACSFSVTSTGFASDPTVSAANGNGHIYANFGKDDDLSGKSLTLTMTYNGEAESQTLTFSDGGQFEVETSGDVDYVGGEVTFETVNSDFGSPQIQFNGNEWIYQTYNGSNSRLTVNYNGGSERTVNATVSVNNGAYSYSKNLTIKQKAYGTPVDESNYHQNKAKTVLQEATAGYTPLNIVIVGDGYQKKDLQKGGKFQRSADSAMEAFFGVEPFKSFRERFRVVMVTYESVDEGLTLEGGTSKNTYFKSIYKGGGNTYVNLQGADYTSVQNVVRNDLGWSDDATYYRTIVIMLINTDEGIGSNAAVYRAAYGNTSTLGEPYASMALAMVTANNTETSKLITHEAGGHAFGRLGDEYPSKTWGSDVNDFHNIGWYRNITVDKSKWNWDQFIGLEGYGDVTYYQPNNTYWCPIDHTLYNSIMFNNTNKFNAPCRQIIYERIIRQTEGASAYSWEKFLEYDKKNL